MNFYELSTLTAAHAAGPTMESAIMEFLARDAARGTLLGLWKTVAGPVNQFILLRGFESRPDLVTERDRARRSEDPFCVGDGLCGLEMASFVPFASSRAVEPGPRSPLYKLTTYNIRPAALSEMEACWNTALNEGRAPGTIVAMYPMDGRPRVLELALCRPEEGDPLAGGVSLSSDELERLCWPTTQVSALRPLRSSPLC